MRAATSLLAFARNSHGGIAILSALSLFLALACIGGAIDFGRAYALQNALQASVDAAALNGVASGASGATAQLAEARYTANRRAEVLGAGAVSISTRWLTETDYEMVAQSVLPTLFLAAVPGLPGQLTVSARALARSYNIKVIAALPSKKDVSYEAADYNQIWAYCYDKNWQRTGTRPSDEGTSFASMQGNLAFTKELAKNENREGRSDFTLISDNGGSSITPGMPTCKEGETISYMLFNSRNNRTNPQNWQKNHNNCGTSLIQTSKSCYTWYTDTVIDANGVEQHDGTSPHQLESVLCEDANCAVLTTPGTYIPANNSVDRIPQTVSAKCVPGKFMYFGWEDRPPQNQGGNGAGDPYPAGHRDPGGDRDYDDIRLIVSCPQPAKDIKNVRLIE